MGINVKRDKFAPDPSEEAKHRAYLSMRLKEGYTGTCNCNKCNTPIIHKDRYDVSESNIGYSIPIVDKDGAIVNWREVTEEEYHQWVDRTQAEELFATKARRAGWLIGSTLTKFLNYFK